jgi:hypothetical protein
VDGLESTEGLVALGAAALALIALLLCLTMALRLRRVRADQRLVLGGRREDLVEHAAALARRVDELQDALEAEGEGLGQRLRAAERRLESLAQTECKIVDNFVRDP